MPLRASFAVRLTWYGRLRAVPAFARFLGDLGILPPELPPVLLSFGRLASGQFVFPPPLEGVCLTFGVAGFSAGLALVAFRGFGAVGDFVLLELVRSRSTVGSFVRLGGFGVEPGLRGSGKV